MDVQPRAFVRVFLCVVFIVSLYGGLALLTVSMFANGYLVAAILSGLVLSMLLSMALVLLALAWSLTDGRKENAALELVAQTS